MGPANFLSPQPNKLRNGHKGLRIFCSEDEQSRTCWLAAFRLFKVRSWPGPISGSLVSGRSYSFALRKSLEGGGITALLSWNLVWSSCCSLVG